MKIPTLRARGIALGMFGVLAATACQKAPPPAPKATSGAASPVAPPRATVSSALATPMPALTELDVELNALAERWNRATVAGDRNELVALYANNVGLYGRRLTREQAVARKLEALRKSPGFSQTIAELRWAETLSGDQQGSFEKTSGVPGHLAKVRAFLLLQKDEKEAWRVIDEGDVASRKKSSEPAAASGKRFFKCQCKSDFAEDPDVPEEPPSADPPTGSEYVVSKVEPPPGAPKQIQYANLYADRFSTTTDVPLFVTVTTRSTNGDGRWFFYEITGDAGKPRRIFECAHGGFWYDGPAKGKPDPAYPDHPEMTSTEEVKRDAEGVHYEKHLYAPDGIQSHVICTLAPEFERYFMPIAKRAGSSLRAEGAGRYERRPFVKADTPP